MARSVEQKKFETRPRMLFFFLWPVALKKLVIFSAINWTTNTPARIYWDMLTVLIQTTSKNREHEELSCPIKPIKDENNASQRACGW